MQWGRREERRGNPHSRRAPGELPLARGPQIVPKQIPTTSLSSTMQRVGVKVLAGRDGACDEGFQRNPGTTSSPSSSFVTFPIMTPQGGRLRCREALEKIPDGPHSNLERGQLNAAFHIISSQWIPNATLRSKSSKDCLSGMKKSPCLFYLSISISSTQHITGYPVIISYLRISLLLFLLLSLQSPW